MALFEKPWAEFIFKNRSEGNYSLGDGHLEIKTGRTQLHSIFYIGRTFPITHRKMQSSRRNSVLRVSSRFISIGVPYYPRGVNRRRETVKVEGAICFRDDERVNSVCSCRDPSVYENKRSTMKVRSESSLNIPFPDQLNNSIFDVHLSWEITNFRSFFFFHCSSLSNILILHTSTFWESGFQWKNLK